MTAPLTYKCAECDETFDSDWTQSEALAEMVETFGLIPEAEQVIVCDVCFKEMMLLHADWEAEQ